MKQFQWTPSDAGQWSDIPEEGNDAEFELIMKLRGPRGQAQGAVARVREVGEWEPYTIPARPEEIIEALKRHLEHNPSSVFSAGEMLELVSDLEKGEERL